MDDTGLLQQHNDKAQELISIYIYYFISNISFTTRKLKINTRETRESAKKILNQGDACRFKLQDKKS